MALTQARMPPPRVRWVCAPRCVTPAYRGSHRISARRPQCRQFCTTLPMQTTIVNGGANPTKDRPSWVEGVAVLYRQASVREFRYIGRPSNQNKHIHRTLAFSKIDLMSCISTTSRPVISSNFRIVAPRVIASDLAVVSDVCILHCGRSTIENRIFMSEREKLTRERRGRGSLGSLPGGQTPCRQGHNCRSLLSESSRIRAYRRSVSGHASRGLGFD